MTHAEGADEHVDLTAVLGVVEQQPLLAVHRVEDDLRLVAGVGRAACRPCRCRPWARRSRGPCTRGRAPPAPPGACSLTATPPSNAKVAFCSCASASSRSPSSTRSGRIALKAITALQLPDHAALFRVNDTSTALLLDLYITVLVTRINTALHRRRAGARPRPRPYRSRLEPGHRRDAGRGRRGHARRRSARRSPRPSRASAAGPPRRPSRGPARCTGSPTPAPRDGTSWRTRRRSTRASR